MLAAAGLVLKKIQGHAGTRHTVSGILTGQVNSYHDYVCLAESAHITVMARAPDGVIEAATFEGEKRMGIMWHPERDPEFNERDMQMISAFFSGEQ